MRVFSTLIMNPGPATLEYQKKLQMSINTNHRSTCKFETSRDLDYVILPNSLVFSVNIISRPDVTRQSVIDELQIEAHSTEIE